MQGKILIVDTVATNRIVLKVKLSSSFYDVTLVACADDALAEARAIKPDLILVTMDMPDNEAILLCKVLKSDDALRSAPVVMLTTDDDQAMRIAALSAGADDVLSKPFDDELLLARIRSLLRTRNTVDELRLRDGTSQALGFAEDISTFDHTGRVAVLSSDQINAARISEQLIPQFGPTISHHEIKDAMGVFGETDVPEVFVILLDGIDTDLGLRLLSDIRAHASTRHASIIVVPSEYSHHRAAAAALDLGANDVMPGSFAAAELALRLRTQIKRKHTADRLRDNMRDGLQAAVIDPLTGLFNRRYAMSHLNRVVEASRETDNPFAVMVADLDFFKQINDRHGHAAGDAVLVETSNRLRQNLRGVDLVARVGGEEFLIILPNTDLNQARTTASRLCREVEATNVEIAPTMGIVGCSPATPPLNVTISIGVAIGADAGTEVLEQDESVAQTVARLLEMADQALYAAKTRGRNCVKLSRPAA
ncbi:MAG: diguanylate cyclase [Paracoccaceae bacterium]